MNLVEILRQFVVKRHVPMRDVVFGGAEQSFVTFFDKHANEVPLKLVAKASPTGVQGELEYFTPSPGQGYYAHLRLAGTSAGIHGGSTRYEIAGPDWATMAHVTEPAAGGAPDVIIDEFTVTLGARNFVEDLATHG